MQNTEEATTQINDIEAEVIPPPPQGIERVRPYTPVTVDELSVDTRGKEIALARAEVMTVIRKAAIKLTAPQDWLLFRAENRVTAFLQDAGCQRVRDLFGIEITPTSEPIKIEAEDGTYAYSITGRGKCHVTSQQILGIEGLRYSTDDFLVGLTPIMKEMRVRQAARANLDGNITRQLAGLKVVAAEDLTEAWAGTKKTLELCARGKGYGSKAERMGAQTQQSSDTPAGSEPICELCGSRMKFIQAGTSKSSGKSYSAFWSCPNGGEGKQHVRSTIPHEEWLKKQPQREAGSDDK